MGRLRWLRDRVFARIQPSWLLIGLGVLLLLNPLYIGVLHLDEPNSYRYDAAEITFENGTVNGQTAAINDHDVACFSDAGRNCVFEHHVLAEDGVALPYQALQAHNWDGHRYAFLHGDFYRTTTEQRNGTTYLTLEQTDSTSALDAASTPLTAVSDTVRQAVEGGTVTTHHKLSIEGELIQDHDTGRFYVMYTEASHGFGTEAYERKQTEGRILEIILMGFLGLVGLWAILRGQRHRIKYE